MIGLHHRSLHRFNLVVALTAISTLTSLLPAMAKTAPHAYRAPSTTPVELTAHPGTELDKQARALNADLLDDAARHHDQPIILTGTARLSPRQKETILFVQLQSYRLCGSAGCTTSIYRKAGNDWETLLDSVNGTIRITRRYHNGMADLLINGNDRWVFDGQHYQDTLNSP
ncbi:hypothetical protein GM556_01825 [Bombella sp. ESL0378]|uniref:hypothetical protein n=1 Tax=Bombella sp. ESL0378 TaxID=2676442 RepID=UPI0012D97ED9|nr:hypothetical protein [Bombella sp. ESL0378]MUG04287.1 hypothetical protein [Bombella sp. ESL0378]